MTTILTTIIVLFALRCYNFKTAECICENKCRRCCKECCMNCDNS